MVFLHGMGCDCRTWDPVREATARFRRVFTPDLPGHGRSPKPRKRYTISLYLDYVIAWLEALGVGPVDLVGHSFGGAVAVSLALERPDLVRSVAAVSSSRLVDHTLPGPVRREFLWFASSQIFSPPSERATRRFLAKGFGVDPVAITPELVTLFRETANVSKRAVFLTNRHMGTPGSVIFDRLDNLRCPVWILWGERDPLFPGKEKVAELVERLPQGRVDLFDCGHLPMFEQPEAFREKLLAHLREV